MRWRQILVVGYDGDHCPQDIYQVAYRVGLEIAHHKAVLVTGGLGGVMEASSRGAKDGGGLVVGIIPQTDKGKGNSFCDVVIATGLGHARDFITAYSADAIIIVGGGVGTLIEVSAAYQAEIPTVALKGSGGVADRFADTYLDDRRIERIIAEVTPEKAVETALRLADLKTQHPK